MAVLFESGPVPGQGSLWSLCFVVELSDRRLFHAPSLSTPLFLGLAAPKDYLFFKILLRYN